MRQCFYLRFWEATFIIEKIFRRFSVFRENIYKTGKNEAVSGLGMTPITGDKSFQVKSL